MRTSSDTPVAIIGGGILGLSLGWQLTRSGVKVQLFERDRTLGGLAASMDLDGLQVDRFYHVILPTDRHVIDLATELGVEERLQFRDTKVGYFDQGQMYSLSSLVEFLRFKPLSLVERLRLAAFVLYCQRLTGWQALDRIALEQWLVRLCGQSLYQKMWLPLLKSKFDDDPSHLPATYLWARTRRMSSNRDSSAARESMGCLVGGYQVLADALAEAIRSAGGEIFTGVKVKELACEAGRVTGLRTDAGSFACRSVISTLLPEYLQPLLPGSVRLEPQRYLGIVCLVLKLSASVSPYYTVNITDRSIPFTTVVETSRVIGSENLGGHSLLYVPKYVAPDSPYFDRSDEQIQAEFLHHLGRMFPDFRPEQIVTSRVMRARAIEPVHELEAGLRVESVYAPLPGLYQTSTAQIYPALVNCEAVIALAENVFERLRPDLVLSNTSFQEASHVR